LWPGASLNELRGPCCQIVDCGFVEILLSFSNHHSIMNHPLSTDPYTRLISKACGNSFAQESVSGIEQPPGVSPHDISGGAFAPQFQQGEGSQTVLDQSVGHLVVLNAVEDSGRPPPILPISLDRPTVSALVDTPVNFRPSSNICNQVAVPQPLSEVGLGISAEEFWFGNTNPSDLLHVTNADHNPSGLSQGSYLPPTYPAWAMRLVLPSLGPFQSAVGTYFTTLSVFPPSSRSFLSLKSSVRLTYVSCSHGIVGSR
jgi:hypothetical protein